MSLPQYPKYKDSGVEWLGEVPEHWKIQPLLGIALERNESNHGMLEDNLLSLSYGRIVQKDIDSNDGLLPESFETYQIIHPGDIVFRLTDLQNDKRSLRTAIVEESGIITSAYLAVVPRKLQASFLSHLLRAYDVTKVFYSMGGGLRQSMKFADVKRLPILCPPPEEQVAITAFLERETGKIDALVEEQRRLIELLKEKRQAVISHAVTKGLNPHAQMKDSGVEWLGEVPEHWMIATVRRVVLRIEQGWSPECIARPAEHDEWGVVKSGCVNRGKFDEQENKALPENLEPISEYEISSGDVLMSRASGSPELVGSTAYVGATRRRLMLSDKIFRIHVGNRMDKQFFVAMFNSQLMRSQIERAISGADGLANNLPQSSLKGFACMIPPIAEQTAIVAYLSSYCTALDALIRETNQAIALLQERRTALISAAVTGKIDVRGLHAEGAA
jgi:type I restriction enzyme S subunit